MVDLLIVKMAEFDDFDNVFMASPSPPSSRHRTPPPLPTTPRIPRPPPPTPARTDSVSTHQSPFKINANQRFTWDDVEKVNELRSLKNADRNDRHKCVL